MLGSDHRPIVAKFTTSWPPDRDQVNRVAYTLAGMERDPVDTTERLSVTDLVVVPAAAEEPEAAEPAAEAAAAEGSSSGTASDTDL